MDRVEIPDDSITLVFRGRDLVLNPFDVVEELNAIIDAFEAEGKTRYDYLDAVANVVARMDPEGSRLTRGQANAFDTELRLLELKKNQQRRADFAAARK